MSTPPPSPFDDPLGPIKSAGPIHSGTSRTSSKGQDCEHFSNSPKPAAKPGAKPAGNPAANPATKSAGKSATNSAGKQSCDRKFDLHSEAAQSHLNQAKPNPSGPYPNKARPYHIDDNPSQSEDSFADLFKSGVPLMGIFSRTRDIIAANFNDMLDKADDPSKMIRMIIMEMEETLVEVRASAARTIADQKEMRRHTEKLNKLQADWGEKAQLALSKDREDLARAALVEKTKAGDMADQLDTEIAVLDDALRAYEQDIAKLQNRLREARSRQSVIAARLESAENRVKLRTLMTNERTDEALHRFDQLERHVDYAEGRADALALEEAGKPSLSDEIAALEGADKIDDELAQMKAALSGDTSPSTGAGKDAAANKSNSPKKKG